MDKQQIKDLLIQIKVFYPRFESVEKDGGRYAVMSATVDSWHRQIGYMEYEEALGILDRYMESDQGNKTPTASLWKRGGRKESKAWHNAKVEPERGVIVWQPEDGPVFERKIKSYDNKTKTYEDEDGYLWAVPGGG